MKLSFITKAILAGTALSLAGGCANLSSIGKTRYTATEAIQTAGQCCEVIANLRFKQLPANKKVRLAVNRDDAIYHYAQGAASFVEALALPQNSQYSLLEIESEVVKNRDSRKRHIFYPVLTFLDENKQVIETIEDTERSLQSPLFARDHMRIAVRLNGNLANARYVLLHTTEDKLNYSLSKTETNELLQTQGFDTMIFAPVKDARFRINFGAEGWVKVLVNNKA